jgi:hypothetical protein
LSLFPLSPSKQNYDLRFVILAQFPYIMCMFPKTNLLVGQKIPLSSLSPEPLKTENTACKRQIYYRDNFRTKLLESNYQRFRKEKNIVATILKINVGIYFFQSILSLCSFRGIRMEPQQINCKSRKKGNIDTWKELSGTESSIIN